MINPYILFLGALIVTFYGYYDGEDVIIAVNHQDIILEYKQYFCV